MIYRFKTNVNNNQEFNFLSVEIEASDLAEAYRVAILKSQYTNNENQYGDERNSVLKIDRQLQGALAEIAVQQLIQKLIINKLNNKFPNLNAKIIRYDEVRTDNFRFAKGEFDLKILIGEVEKTIEVRSSKIRNENFQQQNIIGRYENNVKKFEKPNDFYIKPVFLIPNKCSAESVELIQHLTKDLKLFIVGGSTLEDMQNNSVVGNLGKNTTLYQLKTIERNNQMRNFLSDMMLELSLIAEQQYNTKQQSARKLKC